MTGYELCEETDELCTFVARKDGSMSCRDVCEANGGACVAAYYNSNGCGTILTGTDIGCDSSDQWDDVCVCSRVTDVYAEMPCVDASVPHDSGGAGDAGPPTGTTLLYRVDFEDQTIDADPGNSNDELMSGGAIAAVANPHKDPRNDSDFVGHHTVPTGYTRAELSSQRLPTAGETYLYKWSYFIPSAFFDSTISWNLISQWKTWPCGDHDGYATEICGNCGIFNEINATVDSFVFEFRAEPDCYTSSPPMRTGQWVDFVSEIHWVNDSTGYVRLWQNDQLIYD
ncbi:MAG: heparin lyase I family protein, partial [Deltaproteobacteria bacterium]|nr:heparin lyase I family protein [Deltaproteobacteria bacterium]